MFIHLILLIIFYYVLQIKSTEHFSNFKQIDFPINNDTYLDFLETLNNTTKTLENDKSALDFAFNSLNENSIEMKGLVDETPVLYSNKDHCNIKAINLCQRTNPFQYLVNTKNVAPARWTLYDTPILAKETDLHCWTSMYNCCKNNNFNSRDLEFQNNQLNIL